MIRALGLALVLLSGSATVQAFAEGPIPGAAGPTVDVRPAALRLVDANGAQVGTIVGMTPIVFVALMVNGHDLVLSVSVASPLQGDGFTLLPLQGSADLIFETPDCTGAPFLARLEWELRKPVAIIQPGMVVYVADDSAAPMTITRRSMLSGLGCCYTIEEVVVSGRVSGR